jgi:hypothetical protein
MYPQIIALYLPQFYPFKENDEWWGKGFTEWTNVGKAKPLFRGHYQPRVPADLGYYDLRLPIVREQQVELAKEAGVTAFCYWHYWFGNGRRLLTDVFQEVLDSGKPDFPFCLAWANHTWRAVGCTAGNYDPKILVEQTYPGIEDAKLHFDFLLRAFRDDRYVKIEGKPFLFIFDPVAIPQEYIDYFKKRSVEEGFPGVFLVANVVDSSLGKDTFLRRGFDAVTFSNIFGHVKQKETFVDKVLKNIKSILLHQPKNLKDYRKIYHDYITEIDKSHDVFPQIVPNWDHSPRGGRNTGIICNSSPEYFAKHVREAIDAIKEKPKERQVLILKSWNEWAEGNYMEPDLKFGKGYIKALRSVLEDNS